MAINYFIVSVVLSSVGALLSISLLALVVRADHGRPNCILVSLIVVSVIQQLAFICLWSVNIYYLECKNPVERTVFIICTEFYQLFIFSLACVTVDRFIAFYKPFIYRRVVTSYRVLLSYFGIFVATMAVRIPFFMQPRISISYLIYIDIAHECIYIIVQPVTYFYMYRNWQARNRRLSYSTSSRSHVDRKNREERRFMFVSATICLICFIQLITDLLYGIFELTLPTENESMVSYASNILWITIVIITPVFYVAVRPSIRQYLKKIITKPAKSRSHELGVFCKASGQNKVGPIQTGKTHYIHRKDVKKIAT